MRYSHGNFVQQWLNGENEPFSRERVERAVARMSPRQRQDLRQIAVDSCIRVMRDSNNRALRAQAYAALVKLGVVRSGQR